ncbi:5-oxoprolinase [Alkalicaulis satelles]|uniref:5-oxoprolinase n=1 Tax=Alkalicaulis satelles TaxID=2609175 RepID=A0A5M6ZLV6_9PROT|nr:hydantoinase B/oxoprolinase family protein [Alkalicaulis satelles]KAA5805310.1 5-oxoprolinase [Alkalicaulis satelles]
MTQGLEIWIDRGGTFTDILARHGDGRLEAFKLLSQSPAYDDAASAGVRRALGLAPDAPLPDGAVAAVKMGTTVATNALLELKGARTLFLVTQGFEDALIIGDQSRPDIFALRIDRPAPLAARTVGVAGRMTPEGAVADPLDEDAVRAALAAARAEGFQSVAAALINSYANDAQERRIEALAREAGFAHVTLSSAASPLIRFVPRASTAVIDAYLQPVLQDYVARVARGLDGAPLYFMQSGGGLSDAKQFAARNAVLSGPAGGVVGMALTARAAGFERVIGFDMGGTSTDVSRHDGGDYARADMHRLDGRVLRAPMLAVHTVAAGGGSILSFDGERALAGPHSAGADPGPASYGRGGPAALTDANVVLGRLQPGFFPRVFGAGQDQPLDVEAARKALSELAQAMDLPGPEAAAEGFLAVAVEAMAGAIRQITTAEGVDPRGYALNAFGGAGGQHACRVAGALGITTVLIHPQAGLLSAYGIGLAPVRAVREAGLERALDADGLREAGPVLTQLADEARGSAAGQGAQNIRIRREWRVRAAGSDTAISVGDGALEAMRAEFAAAHERLFGFAPDADAALVLESAAASAEGDPPGAGLKPAPLPAGDAPPQAAAQAQIYAGGGWRDAPVYRLAGIAPGPDIEGPALIADDHQTIVLEPGWRARRSPDGMLILTRDSAASAAASAHASDHSAPDPVTLELFNRRFMGVAEQMGAVLERTAHSVNIKERLDFSCAVFDADGGLVANAPHMPVHLGSMSASVRAALDAHPDLGPRDAVALNAPWNGGTHLPDITVIQPVCAPDGERLFFVAARGHHADVGGIAPGSMPPFSTRIEEEGVVLDAVRLLKDGRFEAGAVRAALEAGPYPARNPDQNIADLKAQLAACAAGGRALMEMTAREGLTTVRAYMGHVQDNAERAVRRVIGALEDGEAEMAMDGGGVIRVAIRVDRAAREAEIDFTGTSAQLSDNFNAPGAVARAAVLYVLRCLVEDSIPLNEGCLKPIRLIIPEASLIAPRPPAAVVAGNVETSQLIVDALFAATGRLAPSQGTMNNLTFGDARRQYYETICGGAGAGVLADGRGFDGACGVHTHMTNSRLTDAEVLELRYPVRILAHRLRTGSGGAGRWRGGDGTVRRIAFLEPMEASLLSGRRTVAPPGIKGGAHGQPGAQRVIRSDGRVEDLPALFRVEVQPGDVLEIETPGGGGWGEAG